MKINQKYIADILKVSRVTVTKALQDHPDISEETKSKIKKLADELGYIPNGVGRSLSLKRTGMIGVVIPKINHSFFSSVIEEMYQSAIELGYQIILMVSFEDEATELANVKSLLSMNVDGILIDSVSVNPPYKSFDLVVKHKKPLIYFDRKPLGINQPGVFFEDYELSYQLTKEMTNRGYQDILYMTGSQQINICYNRFEGFKKALKEAGLSIEKSRIINTELDKKDAKKSFMKYINKGNKLPQAVVCVNDSVALGVYLACEKLKISIPEDLGVFGFGHVRVSGLVQPPLSTVKLNFKEASRSAIQKLSYLIKEGSQDSVIENQVFNGEVIYRGSIKEKA
ncbi:LacI family DNA-binding transcriptional regulator [Galbibacter sp. BG1]|uniref:LacI family DNA-binding transcriptional regulator n=1 Tax=Galbibacter sp. BG1 TaxID=1170699 RepID=UPI0015BAD53F|nr:LacI family DNA-binding transcriptional regulator [Galbibacter sp. BG1]QLE02432.1 LacI family DNA-binding transcriptional regulator [Galbibacter sp. BG1]